MSKFKCQKCNKTFASNDALMMHTRAKHGVVKKAFNKKLVTRYGVIGLAAVFIIFLIFNWVNVVSDAPRITLTPNYYSFGTVSQMNDGVVNTTLLLTNEGVDDLVINDIRTSCGCTNAAIIKNGVVGRRYGMSHTGVSNNLNEVVAPGESIMLMVYYDPSVHKDLRGSVTRSVIIHTNDPINPVMEVKINVQQVA